MNKDTLIFNNFKEQYSLIFNNKDLICCDWDSNQAFAGFVLSLCQNQLGNEQLKLLINTNLNDWLNLFKSFYLDQNVNNNFLLLNEYKTNVKAVNSETYSFFNKFIDDFIYFLETHNIKLNIDKDKIKELIFNGFSYLFFNKINLKINFKISDNLVDQQYENKVNFLIENARLFSKLKKSIFDCCGKKINDLIVLILGMSNQLNYDN